MKTMNYFIAMTLLLMAGSCTKETPTENEDLAVVDFRSRLNQENEKAQEVYELDLHQFALLQQLAKLNKEKKKLEEEIEGGSKNLIPRLESVVEEFDYSESQLIDLRQKLCKFLEIRVQYLVRQVKKGDVEAQKELDKTKKSRENCGIDIDNYSEAIRYMAFIKTPPPTGSCQDPGPDFDSCKFPLVEGQIFINAEERLKRIILTSEKGQTVGEGNFVGESTEINGFMKYALEASSSIESGFLSISGEKENYKLAIEVVSDF